MTDGHTEAGAWIVKLKFSKDQVQQLIRSMETARLVDDEVLGVEPMELVARRAFLQEILDKLYEEVLRQTEAHEQNKQTQTGQEE